MKNIFLLFIVALFFVSTTGVTVYKHYCSHVGMIYGVYIDVSHGCEPEVVADKCCSTSNNNDLKIEDDCCTSDVRMYQMDSDLVANDFKINFHNSFTLALSNSVLFSIPEYKEISTSNKAPPVLTISERLSLFQIYLI